MHVLCSYFDECSKTSKYLERCGCEEWGHTHTHHALICFKAIHFSSNCDHLISTVKSMPLAIIFLSHQSMLTNTNKSMIRVDPRSGMFSHAIFPVTLLFDRISISIFFLKWSISELQSQRNRISRKIPSNNSDITLHFITAAANGPATYYTWWNW